MPIAFPSCAASLDLCRCCDLICERGNVVYSAIRFTGETLSCVVVVLCGKLFAFG